MDRSTKHLVCIMDWLYSLPDRDRRKVEAHGDGKAILDEVEAHLRDLEQSGIDLTER